HTSCYRDWSSDVCSSDLRSQQLEFVGPPVTNYGYDPLPNDLALPRERTRANQYLEHKWENPDYPIRRQSYEYPPFVSPQTNRWRSEERRGREREKVPGVA